MRRSVLVSIVALLALSAGPPGAGAQRYEDAIWFEAGNGTNCVMPQPNEVVTATLLMSYLEYAAAGIQSVAFSFERTFGAFKLSQTNLLGGPDFGDVEVDGWTVTAGDGCVEPQFGIIYIAQVKYLYLGTPGVIELKAHPVDGAVFQDCGGVSREWGDSSYYGTFMGVGVTLPHSGCNSVPAVEAAYARG